LIDFGKSLLRNNQVP